MRTLRAASTERIVWHKGTRFPLSTDEVRRIHGFPDPKRRRTVASGLKTSVYAEHGVLEVLPTAGVKKETSREHDADGSNPRPAL
jgi:hypothetical protein